MELIYKYASAATLSLLALLAPISSLVICVIMFIGIDFVSGVWASRHEALAADRVWFFRSVEAWRTLYKLGFTLMAIVMAWVLDSCVINFVELRLARLFTGFVCGVEMWSFLENASQFSDAPYFEWMRKYVKRRIDKEIENAE